MKKKDFLFSKQQKESRNYKYRFYPKVKAIIILFTFTRIDQKFDSRILSKLLIFIPFSRSMEFICKAVHLIKSIFK